MATKVTPSIAVPTIIRHATNIESTDSTTAPSKRRDVRPFWRVSPPSKEVDLLNGTLPFGPPVYSPTTSADRNKIQTDEPHTLGGLLPPKHRKTRSALPVEALLPPIGNPPFHPPNNNLDLGPGDDAVNGLREKKVEEEAIEAV
ncbi:uncharacterized protein BP5553_09057 [Venustampulla echinocandica]|uniref:Uncharacterized protein n=1 Tax=Venustampulla echinocandica TaxID=2656787 RepID=A0A370TDV2_9HELO|nr:uncharacterized protein BP5553_09057 [Venustampulla echinocandica]RDL32601.1 hypothetical protein BP5553_09057 [Venustampulla echinocandica]